MSTSITLLQIKKDRLTLTTETLRKQFGSDTLYIFAIRLRRLIVIGRLDFNQAPEEAAARVMAKFGEQSELQPEVHTLNSAYINFSKKWLGEAGREVGDLAFCVTSDSDPFLMAIEFLGPEELLVPSVRQWLDPDSAMEEGGE